MTAPSPYLVLVIDPQRAFCAEDGALARAFGREELVTITPALNRLEKCLREFARPEMVWLIRSEYEPGQFTDGHLEHPFAYACVPNHGFDCDWSLSPFATAGKRVITKKQESGASAPELADEIAAQAEQGLTNIFLAGFLTTSCVRKTALDLRRILPESVEISVIENLCGCRASKYEAMGGDEESAYQNTRRILESAGVNLRPDLPTNEMIGEG